MKFICKCVYPELNTSAGFWHREFRVDASSYENAAKAHVSCNVAGTALLFDEPVRVLVRRSCSNVKPRIFSIKIVLTATEIL